MVQSLADKTLPEFKLVDVLIKGKMKNEILCPRRIKTPLIIRSKMPNLVEIKITTSLLKSVLKGVKVVDFHYF